MKTIAEQFCETYVIEQDKCAYILLPILRQDKDLAEGRIPLLQPHANKGRMGKFEDVPAYKIRKRMAHTIRSRKNNVRAIFWDLYMIFSEEAIKRCFLMPNIWIMNHNENAHRARKTEVSIENHKRKIDPKGYKLLREIRMRTSNRSSSAYIRAERELSR